MDPVGEDIGHNNNIDNNTNSNRQFTPAASVVKGKRTKRQRPVTVAATVPASSAELSSSPIEDDDENMANCLILLSRGHLSDTETTAEEAITEAATATQAKAGLCFYRCKTCDRCFPSFQALGGHRASNKKPKVAPLHEDGPRVSMDSICGSEFLTGQALGGHMRRHRPITAAESTEAKKDKNVLLLDLNLPAPSDDNCDGLPKSPSSVAFSFESQQPLFLSSSALVDRHYY